MFVPSPVDQSISHHSLRVRRGQEEPVKRRGLFGTLTANYIRPFDKSESPEKIINYWNTFIDVEGDFLTKEDDDVNLQKTRDFFIASKENGLINKLEQLTFKIWQPQLKILTETINVYQFPEFLKESEKMIASKSFLSLQLFFNKNAHDLCRLAENTNQIPELLILYSKISNGRKDETFWQIIKSKDYVSEKAALIKACIAVDDVEILKKELTVNECSKVLHFSYLQFAIEKGSKNILEYMINETSDEVFQALNKLTVTGQPPLFTILSAKEPSLLKMILKNLQL